MTLEEAPEELGDMKELMEKSSSSGNKPDTYRRRRLPSRGTRSNNYR